LTSKRLLDSLTRQALARIGNSARTSGGGPTERPQGARKHHDVTGDEGRGPRNIIDDHTGVNEVFAHASDHKEQGDEQRDLS